MRFYLIILNRVGTLNDQMQVTGCAIEQGCDEAARHARLIGFIRYMDAS